MSEFRLMVIGAHPDDPELIAAGLAIQMRRKGHKVLFLSMTDGGAGHQTMTREALIERRAGEIKAAASVYDVEYEAFPIPDGTLTPSLENREMLMRRIRSFAPDVIITHRTCDYHPDHRACGQLVMDCAYLLRVPLYCPDAPVPPKNPVILSSYDRFSKPIPFQVDLAVNIDDVFDRKVEGILCHVSQFYEWLPYADNYEGMAEAKTFEEKTELLKERMRRRYARVADTARHLLPEETKYAEAFEWNEYGAPLTEEMIRLLTEKGK